MKRPRKSKKINSATLIKKIEGLRRSRFDGFHQSYYWLMNLSVDSRNKAINEVINLIKGLVDDRPQKKGIDK